MAQRSRVLAVVVAGALVGLAGCGGSEDSGPVERTSALDTDVSGAAVAVAKHCVNELAGDVPADEYGEQYGQMLDAVDTFVRALQEEPDNIEYRRDAQKAAQSLERCGESKNAVPLRDELSNAP